MKPSNRALDSKRSLAFVERDGPHIGDQEKRSVGKGVFHNCGGCGLASTLADMVAQFQVCTACGFHHPMSTKEWRRLLLDDAELELWDEHLASCDPLDFVDIKSYAERLAGARRATGATEGIEVGRAAINSQTIAYGCFNFSFLGGSMGSVVGERITRMFERATRDELPVVLLHASGGARMQEGILSLMQMSKNVAALARFREVHKPYISVLLHNTTGGVAASTAFLGDVNMAEPNGTIGFAGARVIRNTIGISLPEGFQSSQFLLDHGMVDMVVPRAAMRHRLSMLLSLLAG